MTDTRWARRHRAVLSMATGLARKLADSLRRLRERAGLTQTEMARRLGISQPTLNRLESAAQNTTLKTLVGLVPSELTVSP